MKIYGLILNSIKTAPFLLIMSTVFVIRNDLPNSTVTGKYFWFYWAMGIMAATGLCSFFVSRRKIFRFTRFDAAVLVFWLAGLTVSGIHNDALSAKLTVLALLFPLYLYARYWLAERRINSWILVVCLILGGLVEALWGLGQLYGFYCSQHAEFKITGSFFNPGPYSGYIAAIFPLAVYYILRYYRVFNRKFNRRRLPFYFLWTVSTLTFVATIMVIPAAMSRSAWLATVGGSMLALWLCCRKNQSIALFVKRNGRKIAGIALVGLTLALCGMYFLKKDSADGRAFIWKIAAKVVVRHPLGVGVGNFAGAYGNSQAEYFASDKAAEREYLVAGSPEYGFNEYLQICIEWGILPFLLFAAILAMAIYQGFRRRRAVVASLAALLVFAASAYPFNILPHLIVLIMLLAICVSDLEKPCNTNISKFGRYLSATSFAASVITVALCLTVYGINSYGAYKEWGRLKSLYYAGLYKEISAGYETHYSRLAGEVVFLFEYAQILNKTGEYAKSNEVISRAIKRSCDPMFYNLAGKNCQALQDYTTAERNFRHAANLIPNRLYPFYLLAKLYSEAGMHDKAREMAKIVLTKEPKVNSPAVNEMRNEMRKLVVSSR
ncbi:MAG: O-antigen ligase family protein [Prevotellaceae bacterium]|jgi:O-antigen ligase|nr:O-antigen ligase family protein [Prevotellaceae bacterium]